MQPTFTNRLETPSTAVRVIEAVVALGTAMLASFFVVAAVVPQVGFVLIG